MNILVVESRAAVAEAIKKLLEAKFAGSKQTFLATVTEAFELMDQGNQRFELLICCYSGKSPSLVASLLEASPDSLAIVCLEPQSAVATKLDHRNLLATIQAKDIPLHLSTALDNVIDSGAFKDMLSPDADFFPLNPDVLILDGRLLADAYIRLAENRYVKLLRISDKFSVEELEAFKARKKIDALFVKKASCDELVRRKRDQLAKLAILPNLSPDVAAKAAESGLETLQSMVRQVGFTPEVQEVATNSVKVALTMMGKSPTLSNILAHLKKGHGKYITAHSITLGQLACGLSCLVGWTSPGTYFKLTLAAFMHDIGLTDNDAAKFTSLKAAEQSGKYTEDQLNAIRFHPTKAAEVVKNFTSIPPDVDTIVAQHHEQPDGSGFPRGLAANYISPLSALFIISHDLLHYFMENGKDADVTQFLTKREEHYNRGSFRKIFRALQDNQPIEE